ncbi:protein of unknown function, DUF4106 family [Trichomonas vaginalis G3]|uniref:protein of unknown function, DUF4106 family n=1 Tax=Trichomonas vaginalis (strain ATCC PRA-98 / G3) TaxID=412133 RepID=UPI0021E58E32|nr:protein of unknown function, DUF4106 family [Trichomonas vaginalis G3]KAI5549548.1 protein of unknown function, DUF4106 family [Trichomonas vaginalis G3]
MAVADVKLNSPTQTNSQSVIVNVKDRDVEMGKPYEDEDGITIVPVKEPTYPEVNRDLSSVADIRNDYQQLKDKLQTQEKICQALGIMLNLVEHNPVKVNLYVIAPHEVLKELLKLLTEADDINIKEIEPDISCCGVSYNVIDKIYVMKGGETLNLKYSFPDVIKKLVYKSWLWWHCVPPYPILVNLTLYKTTNAYFTIQTTTLI